MDSPLNLAHQQARKADAVLKAGKFEEAMSCHNRAADYLLQAMQQTKYGHALESLKLQHSHHLKQTDKIYDRQRRAQILQIKRNKQQQHDQACQTIIQGPVIPSSNEHSTLTDFGDTGTSALEDDTIYRTLTEQDSLIGLLLRRRQNPDELCLNSFHSGVPVERVFFTKDQPGSKASGKSTDKDTEDLRYHNEDLRKHVAHLLEEVDKLKKENKKYKERAEIGETMFTDVGRCDPELIPDLPPLEMPTFDFNLLTDDNEREDSFDASGLGKSPI